MDKKVAKELLHVRHWIDVAGTITERGRLAYEADEILQEAGDSIINKIGEAATRLKRLDVQPPAGVDWGDAQRARIWPSHRYDNLDRDITWETLSESLPDWHRRLTPMFDEAARTLDAVGGFSSSALTRDDVVQTATGDTAVMIATQQNAQPMMQDAAQATSQVNQPAPPAVPAPKAGRGM